MSLAKKEFRAKRSEEKVYFESCRGRRSEPAGLCGLRKQVQKQKEDPWSLGGEGKGNAWGGGRGEAERHRHAPQRESAREHFLTAFPKSLAPQHLPPLTVTVDPACCVLRKQGQWREHHVPPAASRCLLHHCRGHSLPPVTEGEVCSSETRPFTGR